VSRLDYAPKLKEIKVTDIKKGIGVFTPKPDKSVSFAALKETLKKAGYTLDSADLTVTGQLTRNDNGWFLVANSSGQRFVIEEKDLLTKLTSVVTDAQVEVQAEWKTRGDGEATQEVLAPREVRKIDHNPKLTLEKGAPFRFARASFRDSVSRTPPAVREEETPQPLAPIRTTSPGLTVYKGGAITSRLFFIRQHLGNLDVSRQVLDISVSYTPSPRVQFEVEVPVARTSFDDELKSNSSVGFGNLTLWTKFRFFRKVKTYGDRQASVRFGMELPTGKAEAPTAQQVNASAFVRQQLTPISGGLTPHFDLAFSQAGGRVIFGGNVEGILRTSRDGFRMGNEVRVNTDLEYVLFPRNYQAPGKELFVIFETTFVHRGQGRVDTLTVQGSNSTEFYLSPGLQYAADPRVVVEGSVQLPVVRNTGAEVLRNSLNVLLGVKYLF
jgi:hypothetical protein